MADITAAQARRWALYKRTPNAWALDHIVGRTERQIVGTTGRQVGKTDELADFIDQKMNATPGAHDRKPEMPPEVGILGPDYSKALLSVERYIENLTRVFGQGAYRMNQNEHWLSIIDPLAGIPGATLRWLSAEDAFNVVGHTFSAYGIDEAQAVPDDVYFKFMPTQDVRDAQGLIVGTPDTKINQTWFQGLWDAGQDPLDLEVHSFTIASWDAPWMNLDRIIAAKKALPTNEFRRLYGGEWVEDSGLVFTGFEGSMLAAVPEWKHDRRPVMAVDLALTNDFNVVMIGDPITKTALHMERWNLEDPLVTYDRIVDIHTQWGRPKVYVDATGMGRIPARELGNHLGAGNVVGVEWSSGETNGTTWNKMDVIRELAGDLQHRSLMFPAEWDDLRRELKTFIYQSTPSGKRTAAARVGAHDDIVMTLAMLNRAMKAPRYRGGSGERHNYLTGGADALRSIPRLFRSR